MGASFLRWRRATRCCTQGVRRRTDGARRSRYRHSRRRPASGAASAWPRPARHLPSAGWRLKPRALTSSRSGRLQAAGQRIFADLTRLETTTSLPTASGVSGSTGPVSEGPRSFGRRITVAWEARTHPPCCTTAWYRTPTMTRRMSVPSRSRRITRQATAGLRRGLSRSASDMLAEHVAVTRAVLGPASENTRENSKLGGLPQDAVSRAEHTARG